MTDASARFALPWLQPGQAQKEMTHNEALARIDMLLQPAVQAIGVDVPPASPDEGRCWIVGPQPTGAWGGHAHALAAWTEGGWRFVAPAAGMQVWSIGDTASARWTGTAWLVGEVAARTVRIGGVQVVGARADAVALPAGGSVVDAQSRAAIAALVGALVQHGLIAP